MPKAIGAVTLYIWYSVVQQSYRGGLTAQLRVVQPSEHVTADPFCRQRQASCMYMYTWLILCVSALVAVPPA